MLRKILPYLTKEICMYSLITFIINDRNNKSIKAITEINEKILYQANPVNTVHLGPIILSLIHLPSRQREYDIVLYLYKLSVER